MICFGVCNGIAAIFVGGIIKVTGRSPVIAFALALHVALIVTLLVWNPAEGNKITFFLIAGLWGICDAVWLVQINGKSPKREIEFFYRIFFSSQWNIVSWKRRSFL